MCQPKAQGGRRCIAHAPGTKAVVRRVMVVLHAPADIVKDELKKLNREGRNAQEPSKAEVLSFLEKEEFGVRLDPDLNNGDRNHMTKNIQKQREEVEEGQLPRAGAFHAWKNLFASVAERMKGLKRVGMALGMGGLALAVLSGCGGATPQPSDPAFPSTSPSATAPSSAECEDAADGDSVLPGEQVTDEYGTYCTVVFDENSAAAFNPELVDEAYLESEGFTMEDAEAAYNASVQYVVSTGLDSTRLDNFSQSEQEWFDANRELYYDNGSEYTLESGLVGGGLTFTDYAPEPIVRDGGPRVSNLTLEQGAITVFQHPTTGENVLLVNTIVNATYRATDQGIADAYISRNPDVTLEQLQTEAPQLFDGTDGGFNIAGSYSTSHRSEDLGLIAGTIYNFDLTVDGYDLS